MHRQIAELVMNSPCVFKIYQEDQELEIAYDNQQNRCFVEKRFVQTNKCFGFKSV